MNVTLMPPDLRLIGNAINWIANLKLMHANQAEMSDDAADAYQKLLNRIVSVMHSDSTQAILHSDRLICSDVVIASNSQEVKLIVSAVSLFHKEMVHSPREFKIVTGLDFDHLNSLVGKLGKASFIIMQSGET